jgi:transposase
MSYRVVQERDGHHYLYEATGVWDPKTKNSRQKRKYLGVCDEDGNLLKATKKNRTIVASRTIGPHSLFIQLLEDIGVHDRLVDAFGRDDADLITTMAVMRVIRPGPLRQLEEQANECFIRELLDADVDLDSRSLSRSLARIGNDLDRRRRFCSSMASGNGAIVFDLTSLQSSSRLLEMLEYGSGYRHTGLPQVNLGMVHSLESGLPFHYKLYPGSVGDVRTLRNLLAEIEDMGMTDVEFVMDRGFYSKANISDMLGHGMGFTMPIPFNRKEAKELMSASVKPHANTDNAHMFLGSVVRVNDSVVDIDGRTMRAVVYQDDDRRNDEIRTLFSRLDDFERAMRRTRWHPNIGKEVFAGPYGDMRALFDLSDAEDGTVRTRRRRNAITARENRCGKLILLTTSDDRWDELLTKYRKRNDVEADFGMLKSDLEGGIKHLSSNESAEGLIFTEFVALIARMELLNRIRDSDLHGKVWVPDVIAMLNKLKITRIGDEWRLNEVTKKQRDLYETLGAEPPSESYET